MTASLIASLLLGWDGFVVCLALGAMAPARTLSETWPTISLVGLFGLCDGLALLAGGGVHPFQPDSAAVLPALIGLWAVLVLVLVKSGSRVPLPLLPLLLACDNLLAGMAGGRPVALQDAALSCAVSATLAGAGLLTGRALGRHLRPRHARLAGSGLLLAAGIVAMAA